MDRARRSRRASPIVLLLVLLLVWAVGLRIWYGSQGLHDRRFFDEHFSIPNVHAALEEGSLKPVRYAYLRLTYLPQVAVLGALGAAAQLLDPGFSWFRGETLTPAGFLVSRSVQALIGGLSIFLTFLVGRRLFSSEVGLLAAFLVAASTNHLMLSAIFKPDIVAAATTMIAFLASLRAIERPTVGRYLVAGIGVGLAISSKPQAGVVAIPLTAAALILGFRDRRHWIGLVSAGVTSVVLFLLFNPYPRYLNAFELQRRRYNAKAAQKGTLGDPLATLHHELTTVFQGAHGIWIGAAAFCGLLLIGYWIWKHRSEDERPFQLAMLWLYPVSFILLYGFVTQNVLLQNFVPVIPFTALAAAVFLVLLWRQAARRWPRLEDRRIVATVVILLVISVAYRPNAHAYRTLTPTTLAKVASRIPAHLPAGTRAWIRLESEGLEPGHLPSEPGRSKGPLSRQMVWTSPRLDEIDPRALDRSDFELFPLSRTRGPEGEFYLQRMRRLPDSQTWIVEASPLDAWGPSVVLIRHPWSLRVSRQIELTKASGTGWFVTALTAAEGHPQIAAIEIELPGGRWGKKSPVVRVGGRRTELLSASLQKRRALWVTDRFPVPVGEEVEIRIRIPKPLEMDKLTVVARHWEENG